MTQSLLLFPHNVLEFRDAVFFDLVGQFCGEDIVEYLQLLRVRSVHSLLDINDIFLPLQQDYVELAIVKKKLAFCRSDGSCIIKIGIQHDVDKLLNSLRNASINNGQMTTAVTDENDLIIPFEILQQYPFLKGLINFFITSSQNSHPTDKPFLHYFLENLLSNLTVAESRYRYNEQVLDFAACLSILAGRNAYDFLRINMPGALPSLITIQAKLSTAGFRALEGEFRYDDMNKYMNEINSKFAFCSEDCTSTLRRIVYDVRSNSFIGFTPPLDENGMPHIKYFRTNSIEDLQSWFEEKEMSHLLNLHMIQPICINNQISPSFALAAYGTNGKYTALDIIRRWYTNFEESSSRGIRIVGYSTDTDPKYLLAMMLVSGFFGVLINSPKSKHSSLLKVAIPTSWSWFYLPAEQLFLFMQDATHVCTKLRNRLLQSSAIMMMGENVISIDYLLQLIESQSKFKHNLVKSDICPRDKQNYRSCEKLCAALEYLKEISGSDATVVYINIIRCVIIAFIDTSTTTSDRIYHAWLAVFLCRLWRTWLDLIPKRQLNKRISEMNNISEIAKDKFKQKTTKRNFFITSPSFLCLEINAHNFTYLTLLVAENQLPIETLNVFLFNSQTCERFFQLTRSITGTFSTCVNFSIQQFLNRQEKISFLNHIKAQRNSSLTTTTFNFSSHHKTQRNSKLSTIQPEKITKQQIEEQVGRAFSDAFNLLVPLGIKQVFTQSIDITMKQVSEHVYNHLKKSSKKADFLIPTSIDEQNAQSHSDSEGSITEEDEQNDQNEMDIYDDDEDYDGIDEDNDDILTSQTTNNRLLTMKGVRNTINPDLKDSYFLVRIDGKQKYLHKSTAIWYLTDKKYTLSSDRLTRVMAK
ncbi:unnamed protein product [Rotaria sp. Silwood2]|nr:unnamed protein product [Rotaria sp. Silwood2]CAF4539277.1 unnamed protein product [Rotaria sp. Silwood2]